MALPVFYFGLTLGIFFSLSKLPPEAEGFKGRLGSHVSLFILALGLAHKSYSYTTASPTLFLPQAEGRPRTTPEPGKFRQGLRAPVALQTISTTAGDYLTCQYVPLNSSSFKITTLRGVGKTHIRQVALVSAT